jgi:hypothetical protein
VDHQVEYYVHIEGTRGEDAEPVGLEEHGAVEPGSDGDHRWIEAFEMADLEDSAEPICHGYQFVSLFGRGGDRLLDEQVDSLFKQARGDRKMGGGRNTDRRGIYCLASDGEVLD